MTEYSDVEITCVGCRRRFTWTGSEQQLAVSFCWWPRDRPTPPKRCPACREIQRRHHGPGDHR